MKLTLGTRHSHSRKSADSRRDAFAPAEKGAILVELSLVIPMLLLITVGVVNIASIIWQTQVVMEGMNTAVRKATNLSNDYLPCLTIENEAVQVFNTYRSTYGNRMGVNLPLVASDAPQYAFIPRVYDGYARTLIKISMNTMPVDNCVLCMGRMMSYMPITLTKQFALEWVCTDPAHRMPIVHPPSSPESKFTTGCVDRVYFQIAFFIPVIYFFIDIIKRSYMRYNMLVFAAESTSKRDGGQYEY